MIAIEHLGKAFGTTRALDDVSLVLERGTTYGLYGENGAGKTTLLRILAGTLRPDTGRVRIDGQDPARHWRIKRRMGVVLEEDALFPELTAEEFLWWVGRIRGLSDAQSDQQSQALLTELRLAPRADDPIETLSHGMRRKVLLAAARLGQPEVLLLDEPTNALDADAVAQVERTLVDQRLCGGLGVVASHDTGFLERSCTHIVRLGHGRLIDVLPAESADGGHLSETPCSSPG